MFKDLACSTCKYFEARTGFCRLNPPTPIVFEENDRGRTIQKVSSKFPVITQRDKDYCSKHSELN